MKQNKLVLSIAFSLLLSNSMQAQTPWYLTGNAATDPTVNFLGTTDSKALKIRTNNVVRMTVSSAGNVGIGVSSPTYKLEVSGDSKISGLTVGKGGGNITGNTAFGTTALPVNSTGSYNTAIGNVALNHNTTGVWNVGAGASALYSNIGGNYNTAVGTQSLMYNTSGTGNCAFGTNALNSNTTGYSNVAIGINSLFSNTAGKGQVAIGDSALFNSNPGIGENTAIGDKALFSTTLGRSNTAVGSGALYSVLTGWGNTAIGYGANGTSSSVEYSTALGFGATANASYKVRIGSTSVTVIEGQVAYTFPSDARFKNNVKEDVPGLAFITKLRPVTYNFDRAKFSKHIGENQNDASYIKQLNEQSKEVCTGFIAQEVERVADDLGYHFDGVHAADKNNPYDNYSLAYSQFVVPLVKSVQELNATNEELKSKNEKLENENSNQQLAIGNLQNEISEMRSCLETLCANTSNEKAQSAQLETHSFLAQNQPNPFNEKSTVNYFINEQNANAILVIRNLDGKAVKQITLSKSGSGSVIINANELASGTYTYSLFVNDKCVDTKLMVITK